MQKKGKIFLPDAEYQAISDWVRENSPGELEEFKKRSEKFDGFYLMTSKSAANSSIAPTCAGCILKASNHASVSGGRFTFTLAKKASFNRELLG